MLMPARNTESHTITACHNGTGEVLCRTILGEGASAVGLRFVHETTLPPGTSIGEHEHTDDEEIYLVTRGRGTMIMDGQRTPFGVGDASLVQRGHTHAIVNDSDQPLTIIVVCVQPA